MYFVCALWEVNFGRQQVNTMSTLESQRSTHSQDASRSSPVPTKVFAKGPDCSAQTCPYDVIADAITRRFGGGSTLGFTQLEVPHSTVSSSRCS